MKWEITVKPTGGVWQWKSLARHLYLTDPDERDYVLELLDECTRYAEEKMECSLMLRTITATYWREDLNEWHARIYPMANAEAYGILPHQHRFDMALPRGPVTTIASVKDVNGADVEYSVDRVGNSDRIRLIPNTVAYPVQVAYQAGYASADDVPADIKAAIRIHIATRYSIREAVAVGTIFTVTNLDEFYRLRGRGKSVH